MKRFSRRTLRSVGACLIAAALAGGHVQLATAQTTVYVNPAWSGVTPGADPDGAGPATKYGTSWSAGVDAFSSISAASAWLSNNTNSTIAVEGAPSVIVDASISSNVATITTAGDHEFAPGQVVYITGVSVSSFNGSFPIMSTPSPTTFTYNVTAANATASVGTAFGLGSGTMYIAAGTYGPPGNPATINGKVLIGPNRGVDPVLHTRRPEASITGGQTRLRMQGRSAVIGLEFRDIPNVGSAGGQFGMIFWGEGNGIEISYNRFSNLGGTSPIYFNATPFPTDGWRGRVVTHNLLTDISNTGASIGGVNDTNSVGIRLWRQSDVVFNYNKLNNLFRAADISNPYASYNGAQIDTLGSSLGGVFAFRNTFDTITGNAFQVGGTGNLNNAEVVSNTFTNYGTVSDPATTNINSNRSGLLLYGSLVNSAFPIKLNTFNNSGRHGIRLISSHDNLTNNNLAITNNSFLGAFGGFAVSRGDADSTSSLSLNATGNWWGAADGPSGAGSGSGTAVQANVNFSGFLAAAPAVTDTDDDGLTDAEEAVLGTNASSKDTDGDQLTDYVELWMNTDPLVGTAFIDADLDGLPSIADPDDSNNDIDGDGFKDGAEIKYRTDINNGSSVPPIGDVNGNNVTDNNDASAIFNYSLGNISTLTYPSRADVNESGGIDYVDAVILFNWSLVPKRVSAIPLN